MTGDYDSVIGMDKDEPLNRFLRKLPGSKFEAGEWPGDPVRDRGRDRRRDWACAQGRRGAARRHAARRRSRRFGADRQYSSRTVDLESRR